MGGGEAFIWDFRVRRKETAQGIETAATGIPGYEIHRMSKTRV